MNALEIGSEMAFHYDVLAHHVKCYFECRQRLLDLSVKAVTFDDCYELFLLSECPELRDICLSMMWDMKKTEEEAKKLLNLMKQIPKSSIPKHLRPKKAKKCSKSPDGALFNICPQEPPAAYLRR